MSPRSKTTPMVRDTMIRLLAPHMMRAFNINRIQALEMLAGCSSDERYSLYQMRARALHLQKKDKK